MSDIRLESFAGKQSPASNGALLADLCYARPTFSIARFVVFTLLFLTMIPGSVILFILLKNHHYGVQFASMIVYTSAVVLYTFSKYRGTQRRYLFRCPFVRLALPRLVHRHFGFLVALFALETEALRLQPRLPASWLVASEGRGGMPPFIVAQFILYGCLALAQIISNRALLGRAHRESDLDHAKGIMPPH
jgi:hypothetical protein